VIVHREQIVKRERERERENQLVATIRCLLSTLSQHVSGIIMLIFRRTTTVCYCTWCAALVLLDVVGSGCGAHPTTQRPTTVTSHIQQNQRSTPHAVTHGRCSPEDGHNDARNMLRQC